ncbi:dual specificity phosphatase, catalytic domain-containing protein [Phthorimaea operculella]|nr:dual specificity phosphatase, catalytic domain-containing protein [Phthorimaea operculella]
MDAVDEFLGRDCEVLVGVHCTHGLNRTGYMVCRYMRDRLNIPAKTAIKKVLLGVHCTHGLNRTGYMVCRYMRDRLNIPAKTAIKRFEKARGYEIERENYIADLLGKVPPPPDLNFRNKNTEVRIYVLEAMMTQGAAVERIGGPSLAAVSRMTAVVPSIGGANEVNAANEEPGPTPNGLSILVQSLSNSRLYQAGGMRTSLIMVKFVPSRLALRVPDAYQIEGL